MGTTITARTPPGESEFAAGAPSLANIGSKYASVLPVPVGDIATKSRFYGSNNLVRHRDLDCVHTSSKIGMQAAWMLVGSIYPLETRLGNIWLGMLNFSWFLRASKDSIGGGTFDPFADSLCPTTCFFSVVIAPCSVSSSSSSVCSVFRFLTFSRDSGPVCFRFPWVF